MENLKHYINFESVKDMDFDSFKKACGNILSKFSIDAKKAYKHITGKDAEPVGNTDSKPKKGKS